MSYNRGRRRRVRIRPLGYLVIGIMVLILIVGIYFIIWSIGGDKQETAVAPTIEPALSVTPTPSLAPVSASPEPTAAPTEEVTPAIADDTAAPATDTPKPADTPTPKVDTKTPSPSQIKTAVDGKTTSRLYLRKGPGKDYEVIDTYDDGSQLKIYALEGDFYFVMVVKANAYGYMSADHVEKQGLLPGESATPTPPVPEGVVAGSVSASSVALRKVPSTKDNTPTGTLEHGTAVYIHFKVDGFYYLETVQGGKRGYAYAQYIKAEDSVPSGTPLPE